MGESPNDLVANVLDWDIVVSKFELQFRYMFPFVQIPLRKAWTPFSPPTMGYIVQLLSFSKIPSAINYTRRSICR